MANARGRKTKPGRVTFGARLKVWHYDWNAPERSAKALKRFTFQRQAPWKRAPR
jgi:hypothetical protein